MEVTMLWSCPYVRVTLGGPSLMGQARGQDHLVGPYRKRSPSKGSYMQKVSYSSKLLKPVATSAVAPTFKY